MTTFRILDIGREALLLILIVSGPAVLAALITGLLISIVQAATQIQEQTLTFVPKIIAVGLVLACSGYWMVQQLVRFTTYLMQHIPDWVG